MFIKKINIVMKYYKTWVLKPFATEICFTNVIQIRIARLRCGSAKALYLLNESSLICCIRPDYIACYSARLL